jgi:hypothetical protein
MRLEGIDPIEARKAKRTTARLKAAKAMTFQECADRYRGDERDKAELYRLRRACKQASALSSARLNIAR